VALNATFHTYPGRTSNVSIHGRLPDDGLPSLGRISTGWPRRCQEVRLEAPVDHGEVPVGFAGIEWHGGRRSVPQQVALGPAGGVPDGRILTGGAIRTQPEAADGVAVPNERHRGVGHGEDQVVPVSANRCGPGSVLISRNRTSVPAGAVCSVRAS
jgi:hypothetical protein